MKKRAQEGNFARWTYEYPLSVYNGTNEDVPPYAIMAVLTAPAITADSQYYIIGKPSGASSGQLFINSPTTIQPYGWGAARVETPAIAAFNGLEGLPVPGQEWGPHPTIPSWILSISGKGFGIIGGAILGDPSTVRVSATFSSSTAQQRDFPLINLINMSGNQLFYGNIVSLQGPISDPPPTFKAYIKTFESLVPQPGVPFAVLLSDVGAGQICDAAPIGIVDTQVYYTDSTHGYADAKANSYAWLESATSGQAKILWRENQGIAGPGTYGLQWARVRLDPMGGGGVGGSGRLARAYTRITAATGNLRASWGSGDVMYMDDFSGELDGEVHEILNRWPISYPIGSMVEVRDVEGNVQGTCGPAPVGFWTES